MHHPNCFDGCILLRQYDDTSIGMTQSTRQSVRNGQFQWAREHPLSRKVRSCLLDGEMVVLDGDGLAVFDLLRRGDRVNSAACLIAFDLLELDGEDMRLEPIERRKAALSAGCSSAKPSSERATVRGHRI